MRLDRRVEVSARAQRDLRGIFQYTLEIWGERQSREYEARLYASFENLVQFPELGVEVLHRERRFRRLLVEQHVVYYRATPAMVVIVRVIHAHRDDAFSVLA